MKPDKPHHSIESRNADGYSLVEMLIVVAIIGIVAALAVPRYVHMLHSAKITVAEGDIRQISSAIDVYRSTMGIYPDSLEEVGLGDKADPWGRSYQYRDLTADKQKAKGHARKDKNLVPINSDYDLYSVGEDGKSSPPLTANPSHDDIIRANNGGFIGLATDY